MHNINILKWLRIRNITLKYNNKSLSTKVAFFFLNKWLALLTPIKEDRVGHSH